MKRFSAIFAGVAVACTASALTVTVGPTGATGVNFNSIQQAIDYLATNDPAPAAYHTINVQAGTYDYGDEESFYTIPNNADREDGLGDGFNSKTLIYIDSATAHGNNYLDGLQLVGVGADRTIIDAEQADSAGRVMYVRNNNVRVSGVTIKGGKLAMGDWFFIYGAAMLLHGKGGTYENLIITGNYTRYNSCTRLIAVGYGSRLAANSTYRNIEITGNTDVGFHEGGYTCAAMYLTSKSNLVANVSVHDNAVEDADGLWGILVSGGGPSMNVIFGCLVHSQRGSGIVSAGSDSSNHVVNCTVAGVAGAGIVNSANWSSDDIYAINNIVVDNYAGFATQTSGEYPRLYTKYNLIDQPGFDWTARIIDGYSTGSSDDGTNLTNKNANLRNVPVSIDRGATDGTTTRIYVSNNTLYATNDTIEVDRDKTTRSVTATGTDGTGQYIDLSPALGSASSTLTSVENWGKNAGSFTRNHRPQANSPAVNAGDLLLTGSGFKYVDVNQNGSYDVSLDVIVSLDGYTPVAGDRVVTTDLAGSPRVKSGKIDLGAYERSSAGTVVTLR